MGSELYADVHIPRALIEGLKQQGVCIRRAQEDGNFATADDEDLLQRASELRCVLVTQDHDFLRIANNWQQAEREFSGVFFLNLHRQSRATPQLLIAELAIAALDHTWEELCSQVHFFPALD